MAFSAENAPRDDKIYDDMRQRALERMEREGKTIDPFVKDHNVTILYASEQGAEGVMEVGEGVLNPYGTVHGGFLAALADTIAGYCFAAAGRLCVTQSSTINFLKPAAGRQVFCRAIPQKMGNSVCVAAVEQRDETGQLLTTALLTFFVVKRTEPFTL